MQAQKHLTYKSPEKKRNLIVLIFHIHFLILSLVAVLWVRKKLNSPPPEKFLERKARLLVPEGHQPQKPKKGF